MSGTTELQKREHDNPKLLTSETLKKVVGMVSLLLVLTINMAYAQQQSNRKWAIDFRQETATIHMMLGVDAGREYGRNEKYFQIANDQLPGLTQAQIMSSGSTVSFQLKRAGGTFSCTGRFKNGNGAGKFEFSPDPSFAAQMSAQGYDNLSAETQLVMAIYDITPAFVSELRRAGYNQLTLDQLIKLGMERAEPNAGAGHVNRAPAPQPQPLFVATGGAANNLLNELEAMGYARPSAHQLAAMNTQGVTVNFVKAIDAYFSTHPTIDQLIGMRTQGVTADYINGLASLGYTNLSGKQIVCLKARGITLDFIQSVPGKPSLRKLVMMKDPQGTSAGDCGPETFPND
jgi:hypothetical protein